MVFHHAVIVGLLWLYHQILTPYQPPTTPPTPRPQVTNMDMSQGLIFISAPVMQYILWTKVFELCRWCFSRKTRTFDYLSHHHSRCRNIGEVTDRILRVMFTKNSVFVKTFTLLLLIYFIIHTPVLAKNSILPAYWRAGDDSRSAMVIRIQNLVQTKRVVAVHGIDMSWNQHQVCLETNTRNHSRNSST